MELSNINNNLENSDNDEGNLIVKLDDNINKHVEKRESISFKKKIKGKRMKIPFIMFLMIFVFLVTIIGGIIYLVISSK